MLGADREAMNREREIFLGSAAVCFNTPEETATASDGNKEIASHESGWKLVSRGPDGR